MVTNTLELLDRPYLEEQMKINSSTHQNAISEIASSVFTPSVAGGAFLPESNVLELPDMLLAPSGGTFVDAMVERAVHAQKAFQDWPEACIDQLLQALAER